MLNIAPLLVMPIKGGICSNTSLLLKTLMEVFHADEVSYFAHCTFFRNSIPQNDNFLFHLLQTGQSGL
jgi:hypothetical protein